MKEGKKGEKRHFVFSLLTEEIVELSYEHQGDDHIASTLKRCSNTRGILRIVNILKDLKTPHPKILSISIIPYFKLLNTSRLY